MRIDPNVVVFPVQSTTAGDTRKPRAASESGGSATVVTLSAGATAASPHAERSLSIDVNQVVTAKLDRIRALIDRGEYAIDLDMLSSRIVDDDLLRGGTT
jgi:anti-sigma28 factor (negative regulator of flagellin synthesis)